MRRQDLIDGMAQPGGRTPAPGGLRLVQDLVNTVDRENRVELFDGPAGLQAWLAHRGLATEATVTPGDVRHAVGLREALRSLLHANNGGPDDPQARDLLAQAGSRADLEPAFGAGGTATLVPARDGVAGALGTVVAAAHAAMVAGEWQRLKACPRAVCGWAFHDRSPNHAATWCSMRVCGNRAKAVTYHRRRRRGQA